MSQDHCKFLYNSKIFLHCDQINCHQHHQSGQVALGSVNIKKETLILTKKPGFYRDNKLYLMKHVDH